MASLLINYLYKLISFNIAVISVDYNVINKPITAPYNVEFIGFEVIGQDPEEQPINL